MFVASRVLCASMCRLLPAALSDISNAAAQIIVSQFVESFAQWKEMEEGG